MNRADALKLNLENIVIEEGLELSEKEFNSLYDTLLKVRFGDPVMLIHWNQDRLTKIEKALPRMYYAMIWTMFDLFNQSWKYI